MFDAIGKFVFAISTIVYHLFRFFIVIVVRKDGLSAHKNIISRKDRIEDERKSAEQKKFIERANIEKELVIQLKANNLIDEYEEDRDGIWVKWSNHGMMKKDNPDEIFNIIKIVAKYNKTDIMDAIEYFSKQGNR